MAPPPVTQQPGNPPGLVSGPTSGPVQATADSGPSVLTVTQCYGAARLVGFTPPKAVIAAAIAMAESSGRVAVTSPNQDGGTNVGLMQLDTPHGAGAGHSVAELQHPIINMQVAYKASAHGTNWSAWQTWTQGTYKQFLPGAEAAREKEATGTSPLELYGFRLSGGWNPLSGIPNPLSGIDEIGAVLKSMYLAVTDGKFWRSLGWIVLGLAVLAGGVALFFRKQIGQAAEMAALA